MAKIGMQSHRVSGIMYIDATRRKGLPKWKRSPHVRLPVAPFGFESVYKRWARFLRNLDNRHSPAGSLRIRLPPVRVDSSQSFIYESHSAISEMVSVLRANLKKHPTLAGRIRVYERCHITQKEDSRNAKLETLHAMPGNKKGKCCVCLEEYTKASESQFVKMECCDQLLHEYCMLKWIGYRPTCPLCCADFEV